MHSLEDPLCATLLPTSPHGMKYYTTIPDNLNGAEAFPYPMKGYLKLAIMELLESEEESEMAIRGPVVDLLYKSFFNKPRTA